MSALIAWKTPTHETIYTKIFENKAQTITCALPKLNTKAPYILNTTPNYFLFVASIVVGLLATLNYCFFSWFFLLSFLPSTFSHSFRLCVVGHVATNIMLFPNSEVFSSHFCKGTQAIPVFVHLFSFQFSVCLYLYDCIAAKRFSPILVLSISITVLGVFRFCA